MNGSIQRNKSGLSHEFLTLLGIENIVDEIQDISGRPAPREHEKRPGDRKFAAERRFFIPGDYR